MIIESVGHGKRILAQNHPFKRDGNEVDRLNLIYESIKEFNFKNEDHRQKLINYIFIKSETTQKEI
jgi:hypothetical protein